MTRKIFHSVLDTSRSTRLNCLRDPKLYDPIVFEQEDKETDNHPTLDCSLDTELCLVLSPGKGHDKEHWSLQFAPTSSFFKLSVLSPLTTHKHKRCAGKR